LANVIPLDADESDSEERNSPSDLIDAFTSGSDARLTLRKPLDQDLLDDRVIKALKNQEERKERRAARKRQVRKKMFDL
jgi:hypothetical protein